MTNYFEIHVFKQLLPHGDRTKISSRPFRRGGNGGIRVPADARGWCPVMAPGYVLCASF
jgi:hypothetical protein